jgi:hypothetical protein
MLYTVPHTPNLPNVGELRFQTQGEQPFVFRDCLVEDPRLIAGEQGQFWTLPVKDRRWKWQFGFIHGSYNVPKPDGSLLRETEPQEIAAILLSEMGESGFDVSRLPNQQRPERQWTGQNPAAELDRLCSELGCIVVLNPFSDRVELWPVGDGAALPGGPQRGATYAPVYPAQPTRVRVEAGPTLFQATFRTEAVGLDTDGRWKPIQQLSYKPASSWLSWPPLGYSKWQIPGTYTSGGRVLNKHELAQATVYRYYRITGLAQGGWAPPLLAGTNLAPTSLRDLQLRDELADEEISTQDGGLRPLPAVVYARYYREHKGHPASPVRYPDAFSFDAQHGIIGFSEPMFVALNGLAVEAQVLIECAFHAGANGNLHRHFVESNTGSAITTPVRLVQRPEIAARVIYRYTHELDITQTVDNLVDTTARLNYWGGAALGEYGQQNGGTVNYQQLMPIPPDGLTQQVTWSGGGLRPPRTTVSQAQRHNRYILPLNEYRDRLTAKRAEHVAQNLAVLATTRLIGGGV